MGKANEARNMQEVITLLADFRELILRLEVQYQNHYR
jgi:hypothetical protein